MSKPDWAPPDSDRESLVLDAQLDKGRVRLERIDAHIKVIVFLHQKFT